MKTIKRTDLKKLVYAVFRLFEAQDDECADRRKVAARERAVSRYLDKISSSKEERWEIRFVVELSLWTKRTGESIERKLRELGYEIEEEEKK